MHGATSDIKPSLAQARTALKRSTTIETPSIPRSTLRRPTTSKITDSTYLGKHPKTSQITGSTYKRKPEVLYGSDPLGKAIIVWNSNEKTLEETKARMRHLQKQVRIITSGVKRIQANATIEHTIKMQKELEADNVEMQKYMHSFLQYKCELTQLHNFEDLFDSKLTPLDKVIMLMQKQLKRKLTSDEIICLASEGTTMSEKSFTDTRNRCIIILAALNQLIENQSAEETLAAQAELERVIKEIEIETGKSSAVKERVIMPGSIEFARIALRRDMKRIFLEHAERLLQYVEEQRSYIMRNKEYRTRTLYHIETLIPEMVEESMRLILRQVALINACTECFAGRLFGVKVQTKRLIQQALNSITNETFAELIQQIPKSEDYARRLIQIMATQERKKDVKEITEKAMNSTAESFCKHLDAEGYLTETKCQHLSGTDICRIKNIFKTYLPTVLKIVLKDLSGVLETPRDLYQAYKENFVVQAQEIIDNYAVELAACVDRQDPVNRFERKISNFIAQILEKFNTNTENIYNKPDTM